MAFFFILQLSRLNIKCLLCATSCCCVAYSTYMTKGAVGQMAMAVVIFSFVFP